MHKYVMYAQIVILIIYTQKVILMTYAHIYGNDMTYAHIYGNDICIDENMFFS